MKIGKVYIWLTSDNNPAMIITIVYYYCTKHTNGDSVQTRSCHIVLYTTYGIIGIYIWTFGKCYDCCYKYSYVELLK
jgi:hypothetical protein